MILRFMTFLISVFPAWLALGAAPAPIAVSLGFQARISDAARLRETWIASEPRSVSMRETSRASRDDVQVELTPRATDGEYILLAYRILRSAGGRWVPLSSGDLKARNGHPTELIVGGSAASGHFIALAVRAQAGRAAPLRSGGTATQGPVRAARPRFQRL